MTRVSKRAAFLAACLQFDVRRGDVAANLDEAERLIRRAHRLGVELAVLPELWSTSFQKDYPPALLDAAAAADERIRALSAELRMTIAGSTIQRAAGHLYNRCSLVERGTVLGEYRKIHLFSPNAENRILAAGERPIVVDSALGRIGLVVCYDIRFPELIRWYFYHRTEIMVVPAQWPEARATHWRALTDARAVENQMFVLGCNRTGSESSLKTDESLMFPGNSRIIDPMGEALAVGDGGVGAVIAEIAPRKVSTMRRMMPIERDRRPSVYREIWEPTWAPSTVSPRTP